MVGSLALISDAGHNLAHALILLISLFSNRYSQRKANEKHTYGFQRASILAAEFNAIILILLASYIFYAAAHRILHPEPVSGLPIALVAFIGIFVNGSIAMLFRNNRHDLNIRSIFINLGLDALSMGGAFIAGLIIYITHLSIFDPLISVFISCLIFYSAWKLMERTVHVLMEGTPEGINPVAIKQAIENMPYVKSVHDFHVWGISSQFTALSCHVVIENCELKESVKIIKQIKAELKNKFNIEHATIETGLVEYHPS
jgi:cobalt-zinc-cadmium efflux system protein